MKKLIWILCGLVLICSFYRCNDCNDCGSYTSLTYSIKNTLDEDLKVSFFGKSGQLFETILTGQSSEVLYQISVVYQSGLLFAEPSYFDSLKIYSGSTIIYNFNENSDCGIPSNGLCESNYLKIKEEKSTAGNLFIEYRLDLK